jgi:hypothetical protein
LNDALHIPKSTTYSKADLSQHIFKLRKALGDTIEGERYIVTLPGRGYRFAVPVRTIAEGGEVLIAQMRSRTEVTIEQQAPEPVEISSAALPPPTRAKLKWLLPSTAIAVAALGSLLLLHRHRTSSLNSMDAVLVADFTNLTGDPVFDSALRQGLEVQLQQSPYVNLVSEDRIQQTLRLMGEPPDKHVLGQIAREVCLRTDSVAVLEGSIQNIGAQYVLNVRSSQSSLGGESKAPIEKWSKVTSNGSLPGAETSMPILTGTCGGKYARRIMDHFSLSREYETCTVS